MYKWWSIVILINTNQPVEEASGRVLVTLWIYFCCYRSRADLSRRIHISLPGIVFVSTCTSLVRIKFIQQPTAFRFNINAQLGDTLVYKLLKSNVKCNHASGGSHSFVTCQIRFFSQAKSFCVLNYLSRCFGSSRYGQNNGFLWFYKIATINLY